MTIKTDFEIGEEVYYIFKEKGNIVMNKGTVDEITIQKDGEVIYFVSDFYDELKNTDLLHGTANAEVIGNRIKVLFENGR